MGRTHAGEGAQWDPKNEVGSYGEPATNNQLHATPQAQGGGLSRIRPAAEPADIKSKCLG